MNEKIVVLTYNHPHRKTQDLCYQLKLRGYDNVVLISTPWTDRAKKDVLWQHRPSEAHNPPVIVANALDYEFVAFPDYCSVLKYLSQEVPRHILIAGASILPKDMVSRWKIINAHPGYLPDVRGLDALKWAIYDNLPIGVTVHFCGEEADTGILIYRQEIELRPFDTLDSVGQRIYELEITMLADGIEKWTNTIVKNFATLDKNRTCRHSGLPMHSPVHGRMPITKEAMLKDILQERILREHRERLEV